MKTTSDAPLRCVARSALILRFAQDVARNDESIDKVEQGTPSCGFRQEAAQGRVRTSFIL